MTHIATRRSALGAYGEALAAQHLVERGMVLLDRNWRCELGEIDIVAREGDTLVVCEVKTRRGLNYGSPLEAVTYRKLATLRKLAGRWLQTHQLRPAEIRIDVIAILFDHDTPPSVDHVRGAA
jgi:putative endonuclease